MLKWFFIGLGATSFISGALTFWLPLPIGIPLMLLGTSLLIRNSRWSRYRLLRLVRHHPALHTPLRPLLRASRYQSGQNKTRR